MYKRSVKRIKGGSILRVKSSLKKKKKENHVIVEK
jgi:hypothetical protein